MRCRWLVQVEEVTASVGDLQQQCVDMEGHLKQMTCAPNLTRRMVRTPLSPARLDVSLLAGPDGHHVQTVCVSEGSDYHTTSC